jgi:hypothetical protein
MSVIIEIEGVDKTSLVQQRQLSITDELNSRNTYSFEIISEDYRPEVGYDTVVCNNNSRVNGAATFTRASVATRIDGTEVASGEPRYETGQFNQAIMIEEATTNLLTANQSDIETDTTGFTVEIGGTLTRVTSEHWQGTASLRCQTDTINYGLRLAANILSSTTYTFSVYLKGTGKAFLMIYDTINVTYSTDITLTSTWTRYSVSLACTSALALCYVRQYNAGTMDCYCDGFQLEQKAYATSWIQGGATRAAETLTIPTAGVLNASAGTIECWHKPLTPRSLGYYGDLFTVYVDGNHMLQLLRNTTNKLDLYWGTGSAILSLPGTTVLIKDTWYFVLIKWTATNIKVFINGILEIDTGATTLDLGVHSQLDIGCYSGAAGYEGSGLYDDLRISNIARTNTEILAAYNSGRPLEVDEYTTAKLNFDGTLQINARTKLFAGTVDSITEYRVGISPLISYKINCVDFNQLCDRFLVAEVYESYTAGDIVKDIIDTFMSGESVTYVNVQDGPTVSKAVFNYVTVTQALNELSEISGYNWWIDYDKDMHFCSRLTNASPFSLTDISNNFRNFIVKKTREDYRNRQYFRGGQDISSPQTETFLGDGERITFSLSLPVAKVPSSITVDAVAKTIGIRQVDTGKDWYWNEGEKEISQDTGGVKLTNVNVLSVTYQGYFPIMIEAYSESAIAERQSVEGGTGIYEHVSIDTSVNTYEAVQERAEALIRKYAEIPETIEFETDNDGLQAGQLMPINVTLHNINSDYLIQKVSIADITAKIMRYKITALSGEYVGGWVDFFQSLARAGYGYVIRENEVLLKIRRFTDNLKLTDTLTADDYYPVGLVGISNVGYCETSSSPDGLVGTALVCFCEMG